MVAPPLTLLVRKGTSNGTEKASCQVRRHRASWPGHTTRIESLHTPPLKSGRLRPGWHKAVGAVIFISGITVVILNQIMLGGSISLLPGRHSVLYLMLGVVIALYSTRWFGWFDREK